MPAPIDRPGASLIDAHGRALRDLRISVTDRCNFRCVYCMPKESFGRDHAFLPRAELLTFEEITRIARLAAARGIGKIRLTGGEPLLRKDLHLLVRALRELRTETGARLDVALTTNGSLLAQRAEALRDAGLDRVTVSLDSLDDETFMAMNDVRFSVARVLAGIDAARAAGMGPIKVNMVVKRGMNDHDVVAMARHFKGSGVTVRFIEYMDVGVTNGWLMEQVVPSAEVVARIHAELPVERVPASYPGETSVRYRYLDGSGEIGVISSVTQSFCSACTRVRISTDGKLYTCLFATQGHDVRALLRAGCSDAELDGALAGIWRARTDRYSDERGAQTPGHRPTGPKVEMSYIGG